jgi:hypothetical protein
MCAQIIAETTFGDAQKPSLAFHDAAQRHAQYLFGSTIMFFDFNGLHRITLWWKTGYLGPRSFGDTGAASILHNSAFQCVRFPLPLTAASQAK